MTQLSSISSFQTLRDRLDAMPSLSDAARLQGQRSFEKALGKAQGQNVHKKESKLDEARAAAEELVARALVQPILAKMRESRETAEPFGTTEVERAFGSISDAQFADRLTKGGNWSLVDAVAQRIMNVGKPNAGDAMKQAQDGPGGAPRDTAQTAGEDAVHAARVNAFAPLSVAAWAGVRKATR